jgi:hypothetical protein
VKITVFVSSLCCVLACQSRATPVIEEPTPPPLPSASGTPVGLLIDESVRLQLRADQLDQLHELDRHLAIRLDVIDSETRELDRPPELPPPGGGAPGGGGGPGGGGPGGGGPGGGMGGGPRGGGGMGGGGMGGGGMGGPPTEQRPMPKGPPPDPAERDKKNALRSGLLEERDALLRSTIARALEVLDPDQRPIASAILHERGADEPSPQGPGPGRRPPPPPGGRPPPRSFETPTPVERP